MSLNPYYEDEIGYLRDLGDEFSKANPVIAGFLGRESHDPDVERLLEGFAFLTSRLRQRLDDELPEVVHSLMRLVSPHYLRPVPPMTIMQFNPLKGTELAAVVLPAGAEVMSSPIEDQRCRFRTAYPLTIMPFALTNIELDNRASSARLSFNIEAQGRARYDALEQAPLRLFLNAEREPLVGRFLLAWMLRRVTQIVVSTGSKQVILTQKNIKPVGYNSNEAILPYPDNAFSGFRLVQEYMNFPEKFLFVDLTGLEAFAAEPPTTPITLRFEFSTPFPEQMRSSDKMIQLNCVPAINLFSSDATPIRLDKTRTEYRIRPLDNAAFNVYNIEQVVGYTQGRGSSQIFPFEAMRHETLDQEGHNTTFYRERVRPSTVGQSLEHYVAFVNRSDRAINMPFDVASLSLMCTNGQVANRLGIGSITHATPLLPSGLVFRNILPVTREAVPPIGDNLLWRLVSNLSRNFESVANATGLRSLFMSYDFRAIYDTQARRRLDVFLESIESFKTSSSNTVVKGVPVRLREITLYTQETKLGSEGELFLLGSIVDGLLTAYAGINNLHRFSIEGNETGLRFTWPLRTDYSGV